MRAVLVGSGSEIPPNRVTNAMLSKVMDTSDEWIRERSGVESRHFVDKGTSTSDLGVLAARRALDHAGVSPEDVDLVVFATMTPDHYFPGAGGLLQAKLSLPEVPCFDIRQQCVGFLFALQLADAHIRASLARTVLVVGAEVHSGFMPWSEAQFEHIYGRSDAPPTAEEKAWNNRFRHLTVLFGDAGAAVVVKGMDTERGILDQILRTNGTDHDKLYVKGNGFGARPYVDREQLERGDHIPSMDGRFVFKAASLKMVEVSEEILERNGLKTEDLSLVLMHQANLRINEHCQKALRLPDSKVVHNITRYGNTTAATIPLLWDECQRSGRLKEGDLVLMVAFGAGMAWGATLVRV